MNTSDPAGGTLRRPFGRPPAARPGAVGSRLRVSATDLVEWESLDQRGLPRVIRPAVRDVDLPAWCDGNRESLGDALRKNGAVLFRGFGLGTQGDFQRVLEVLAGELMNYVEGATPRTRVAPHLYTSTEFPQDQHIALHNELSYVTAWPTRLWFFCETPADDGGETPLADVRRVYQRIDRGIRDAFAEKGWMLVRNYLPGLGLHWQTAFHTHVRQDVERYCAESQIECEWVDDDHLRTRQVRRAVYAHPETGEDIWFNHIAFWHVSSLEAGFRELFLAERGEDQLPYNTYYGDGTPIDAEVIQHIRAAYEAETVPVAWQSGDLLLLENMLVAHGRYPFSGSRRVLAAMGDPIDARSVPDASAPA